MMCDCTTFGSPDRLRPARYGDFTGCLTQRRQSCTVDLRLAVVNAIYNEKTGLGAVHEFVDLFVI